MQSLMVYRQNTEKISTQSRMQIEAKKTEIVRLLDELIHEYEILTTARIEVFQKNRVEVFLGKLHDLRIRFESMKSEYTISERNYGEEIKRLEIQVSMQMQTFEATQNKDNEELHRLQLNYENSKKQFDTEEYERRVSETNYSER